MKNFKLKILPTLLIDEYLSMVDKELALKFDNLKESEVSTNTFSFYTSVSAIASSRIEGEQMEIDSYLKHKMLNIDFLNDLTQKPNDLYQAYIFAQSNQLSKANFLKSHKLIAAHLLPAHQRGATRKGNMVVMEHKTYRVQFEAAWASKVDALFSDLWKDIESLKKQHLSVEEVFYFASIIHLVFVNIHPFDDGNGRAGRLLEKWFIAQKLGEKAWFIQSELYYYQNVNDYYKNLNRLGVFYDELDYQKSLPFLLMLSKSVQI